mgnify:CR=1 FL=1
MIKKIDFEKLPVVEVVNDILVDAAKRGASDIHFDPLEDHMKVRIRIDGDLIDYAEVPNEIKKNLVTRIKIISGMNITESRLPQDGAIKTTLSNMMLDLRVSALPTNNGEKIVIRILDYSMSQAGLESLGFSKSNYEKVLKMIGSPNGIILVTGATGSGKSTTVYSILQRLNKEETRNKFGEEQVLLWRRSTNVRPPELDETDERYPGNDPKYKDIKQLLKESLNYLKDKNDNFIINFQIKGFKILTTNDEYELFLDMLEACIMQALIKKEDSEYKLNFFNEEILKISKAYNHFDYMINDITNAKIDLVSNANKNLVFDKLLINLLRRWEYG